MKEITYQREVSCFLVPDYGILSVTTNNESCAVEFDFFTIWEKIKKIGQENYKFVWMLHSHPPGIDTMSSKDSNMVYGWVQAIGKPILFSIITENKVTNYMCKRDKNNKSKINRDIIDEDLNSDCNSYFFLLKKILYQLSTDTDEVINANLNLVSIFIEVNYGFNIDEELVNFIVRKYIVEENNE